VIQSSTLHATISQERIYDNVSDFHHTSYYITLLQQDCNTPHRNTTQKLRFISWTTKASILASYSCV